MQKYILLCFCIYFWGYAFGQFAADFRISNDPNVLGILTGAIYYDQTTTNLRLDYTLGVIEMFNFTAKIRYIGCPQGVSYHCDAETYKVPFPKFFVEGGDTNAGQTYSPSAGRTCTRYNKQNPPNKGVSAIWVDQNNNPCRALFAGTTKQIDFSNFRALGGASFTLYRGWGCPQQQCNRMMDFIMVFDESGSIDSTSFNQEKSFARSIAQSYTFGSYGVAMGLVMFSGSARRIIYPTVDQQSAINAINGVVQQRGSTCIPCGVDIARSDFSSRGRPGASKIMIVLTDGENFVRNDDFDSVMTAAHNEGILSFAIGVGAYNSFMAQLYTIASDIPGVTTVFTSSDFSQLQGLLTQLIGETCIDIPGNPCGAGCNGFCSCNQVCLCPDTCDDGNACTQDLCTPNANGNGCRSVTLPCNDNNACTNDFCSTTTGCYNTTRNCDDGDACTIDTCNPATGCSYTPRVCNDNNPCTRDLCSPSTGCYTEPQSCNRCIYPVNVTCPYIPCYINQCDPATGNCTATPRDCDDGNACTNDGCNFLTGNCTTTPVVCNDNNLCTLNQCDPVQGCSFPAIDVATACDDFDVCTTDTCEPLRGCVHTRIHCYDGDNCTTDSCNSVLGCIFPTRVCANELNVGQCSVAVCEQDRGCFLEPVPSLTLDCGLCSLSGETCQDQDLGTGGIIGISSGVAAAIGLAVVAVVAVISGFSGKKLYDVYVKNKGNLQGAQMSPLYQDNGLSGTNPLFEHPK